MSPSSSTDAVLTQVLADADRYFAARADDAVPTRLFVPRRVTVEAKQVLVGYENIVAEWCNGHPQWGYGVIVVTDTGQPVIAAYGDWIVRGPSRTYRIVSDGAIFSEYESLIPTVSE